ncbi:MAG: DUF542 domain-containing protein [Gemmatimonadaceae bacterium]
MSQNPHTITTDDTVDAVIAMTPDATAVLNTFNIDTCCGGRASIGEAAAHAHVDPATVIEALQAKSCGCGCK